MSLLIRPMENTDAQQLVARFASTGRSPWMPLTHPWRVSDFLVVREGATTLVALQKENQITGVIRVVKKGPVAMLMGPLLPDDQLAELMARHLVKAAQAWAVAREVTRLTTQVAISAENGLNFYRQMGFQLSKDRYHILALHRTRVALPVVPEPYRMGPCPELLSRDYLQAIATIFGDSAPQAGWSRADAFEHLQRPDVHIVTLRDGDRHLGLVELIRRDGDIELVNVGLAQELRGQGLGSGLIATSLHHAFEYWGAQRVWVGASSDDMALRHRVLRRLGFRQGDAMVLFEKDLADSPAAAIRPNRVV